ncbi:MAG: hypothetical protein P8020_21785 [Acidobacteriota bacterium]
MNTEQPLAGVMMATFLAWLLEWSFLLRLTGHLAGSRRGMLSGRDAVIYAARQRR